MELKSGAVEGILCEWWLKFLLTIRGIHKRMVQFQKLTRNLFVTLHGHNVHRQQWQLSKFLMRYQQFASHAYCGAAGSVSKMAPRPRSKHDKRTAGSARETWTVAAADGVRCARVRWQINFLLTFETAPFFCVYPVLCFHFVIRPGQMR